MKFFSLFVWLLAGGKLEGLASLLAAGGWAASSAVALPLGPGGSLGFQLLPGHLAQALVMSPSSSALIPKASYFANIWLPPSCLLNLALPASAKPVLALNSLCSFHFPAQTLTDTHVSGIFVLSLVGQFLNTKCFIVTKLLFKVNSYIHLLMGI